MKGIAMELSKALPVLRALADGVHPATGEVFPEPSPYAEANTLRALYTAVGVVEREIDYEKRQARLPANFGKPWSDDEDKLLATRFREGQTMQEMARAHARTLASCRPRLEKLGLISPAANA
jgi:hypothetical protein